MSRNDPQQNMLRWENTVPRGSYRTVIPFAMPNAQAANAELLALQWSSTTTDLIVDRIRMTVSQSNVAASAEMQGDLRLFKCANYSANDTGGTTIAPQQKNRVKFGTSAVADLRYANGAAAGLTVGTRTLEAQPILGLTYHLVTVANLFATYGPEEMTYESDGIYPEMLSARAGGNEGFILRSTAAHPATGAAVVYVTLEWTEVAAASLDA